MDRINEPMRCIPEALVGTTSNMPIKKVIGSEAGKQPGNRVCDGDVTLSKSPKAKRRSSPKPTQTTRDEGMESQHFAKSAPTGNRAFQRNVSASATQLVSNKDRMEDKVTCKICQQSLPVTAFPNSQLKELRQGKAKDNPMKIVFSSCTMSNMPNNKANADRASKGNASASSTQLASKKDQMEGNVRCKVCQQNLAVARFSNSQLKKLKKAKAKGKPMPIVCTTCSMSNVSNKKARGLEVPNVGNGRGATVSKLRHDNGKGIERSPNNLQSQQRSSKANASSSKPAAATRSTHDSTAKTKSRDRDKQPRKVMTAPSKRVVAQPQLIAVTPTTAPALRLTHNQMHTRTPANTL